MPKCDQHQFVIVGSRSLPAVDVQCRLCGQPGRIRKPTEAEVSLAFYATVQNPIGLDAGRWQAVTCKGDAS